MNGKKAKAIRRAARAIAIEGQLDEETHYIQGCRTRNPRGRGTFVVADCDRAAIKQIKGIVKSSSHRLPIRLIDRVGADVADTHQGGSPE